MSNLIIDKKIYKIQQSDKIVKKTKSSIKQVVWNYFVHNIFEDVPEMKVQVRKRTIRGMEKTGGPKFLKEHEYDQLIKYNFLLSELKYMCKHYGLKVGGKKSELIYRLWNYLKYSYYSMKIKKCFKNYLIKKFNYYKGNKHNKCVNDSDFMTLESIKGLEYKQKISYKDKDGFEYGFDICSLYNLYLNAVQENIDIKIVKNPFNRNTLPIKLYKYMKKMIRYGNILNLNIKYKIEDENVDIISEEKVVELRVQSLFHNIDILGFITDVDWFLSLTKVKLLHFLRELVDIWEYRAQLLLSTKRNICPPLGNPFTSISWTFLQTSNLLNSRKIILNIVEKLVNGGINEESKYLGSLYVLGALTIVNFSAATSLPWLYESFMPNNNNNMNNNNNS